MVRHKWLDPVGTTNKVMVPDESGLDEGEFSTEPEWVRMDLEGPVKCAQENWLKGLEVPLQSEHTYQRAVSMFVPVFGLKEYWLSANISFISNISHHKVFH